MPLVSIIIPVYNAEGTLRRCLDSLVAQTYKNIEILLVNDGSDDASEIICKEYCFKYGNFKLLSQENNGPATARNNGIDHANGKYVYFVDADDYVEPKIIETMVKAAEKNSAEMVICNYYIEKSDSISIPHQYAHESKLYIGKECEKLNRNLINDVSERRIPPYSWVRMVLKSSLENPRIRYEKGMIRSEDFHFFVRLQFRLNRIYVITEHLYHYVELQTSITHRYVPEYWKSVRQIYIDLCNILPKDDEIQKRLDIMLLQRTLIALNNSSHAKRKTDFRNEVKEIVKDKMVKKVIDQLTWAEGKKEFGFFYVLMKLRLYFLVSIRYEMKYEKERKRVASFEKKQKKNQFQ